MAQLVQGVIARSAQAPVEVIRIEIPEPGPHEAVVAVQACGVCETDLNHRDGRVGDDFPYLLGHEAAGVVEQVGDGVEDLRPGDFVILNWRAVCGECRACRKAKPWNCLTTHTAAQPMTLPDGTPLTPVLGVGGLAEKTLVHAGQCTKIAPDVDPAAAALLGCGIATGIGAALHTGAAERGDAVAVFGCDGIGIAAIAGARLAGADPHHRRRLCPTTSGVGEELRGDTHHRCGCHRRGLAGPHTDRRSGRGRRHRHNRTTRDLEAGVPNARTGRNTGHARLA